RPAGGREVFLEPTGTQIERSRAGRSPSTTNACGTPRGRKVTDPGLAAAGVEVAQRVLVHFDAEAWPRGNSNVRVDDGDLLGRDLLAVLQGAHQVGRIGEVRERRCEVQAHGAGDAHLDHAADHHANAARRGNLSRLQTSGRAAELG